MSKKGCSVLLIFPINGLGAKAPRLSFGIGGRLTVTVIGTSFGFGLMIFPIIGLASLGSVNGLEVI